MIDSIKRAGRVVHHTDLHGLVVLGCVASGANCCDILLGKSYQTARTIGCGKFPISYHFEARDVHN